jgi:hypothetical protein
MTGASVWCAPRERVSFATAVMISSTSVGSKLAASAIGCG